MTQTQQGYALADQEGQAIWFLGTLSTIKANSEQTRNAYSIHIEAVPAGAEPPPHLHRHLDEAFYILDGAASIRCGEQRWHGKAGTFVFLPRGIPHAFKVEGNAPLKIIVITSPGGTLGFEHFIAEMGTPAQTYTIPAPEPPDMEKLQRLATKYDIEFVGNSPRKHQIPFIC